VLCNGLDWHPRAVYALRASIHLEKDKPPKPLWLAWQVPANIPDNLDVDAKLIWEAYVHRWPVEPGIRFRKQRLAWTRPQFQHKETTNGVDTFRIKKITVLSQPRLRSKRNNTNMVKLLAALTIS